MTKSGGRCATKIGSAIARTSPITPPAARGPPDGRRRPSGPSAPAPESLVVDRAPFCQQPFQASFAFKWAGHARDVGLGAPDRDAVPLMIGVTPQISTSFGYSCSTSGPRLLGTVLQPTLLCSKREELFYWCRLHAPVPTPGSRRCCATSTSKGKKKTPLRAQRRPGCNQPHRSGVSLACMQDSVVDLAHLLEPAALAKPEPTPPTLALPVAGASAAPAPHAPEARSTEDLPPLATATVAVVAVPTIAVPVPDDVESASTKVRSVAAGRLLRATRAAASPPAAPNTSSAACLRASRSSPTRSRRANAPWRTARWTRGGSGTL